MDEHYNYILSYFDNELTEYEQRELKKIIVKHKLVANDIKQMTSDVVHEIVRLAIMADQKIK